MWVGTHNGVTLYDGTRTTNFLHDEKDSTSLGGNFITNILEDSSQQVWIGNEAGIDLYNRTDNTFSHYGIPAPDGKKDKVFCIPLGFRSATDLWLLETKTKSLRSLNTKTKTISIITDLNAQAVSFYKSPLTQTVHTWSYFSNGTIHQVFNGYKLIKQESFFTGNNDSFINPQLEVVHVFQQNDTTAWISSNKGLVKLNPLANTYRIFNRWQDQIVDELRFAALSPEGMLWVASGAEGVYTFDVNTNQFIDNYKNYKSDLFSICSDNIVSIYFDRSGNMWCGSYGNGLSYTNIENVFFNTHISRNETLPWKSDNKVLWIGYDRHENLWCTFTNTEGFWILDKKFKVREYRYPLLQNGKKFNGFINKLFIDTNNDDVWCATSKGLFIYNLHTNRMYPVEYSSISDELMGSKWINDIIRLKDNSIIFSTFGGLYRVTKESGKAVVKPFTTINQEEHKALGQLFQDEAEFVYVKNRIDLLYILKSTNKDKEYNLIKKIHFPPTINHYFNDQSDSIIYLATNAGLYYINNKNFQIEKEELSNKLLSSNISSVLKTDKQLWVFGEKGLYYFDKKNKASRTFTVEDGLSTNEFSMSALVFNRDQRCIAGTADGLVSFFPHQLRDSVYPPRAQLTGIYINDILRTSIPNSNEIKKISLSFRENTFSFDFSLISFQHESDRRFEYKLEGYDETWIKSGIANYTRYSKIPPGNYTFNIRVIDVWGRVSPFTKTLGIQISKAFWQTNFFKIAVLALIAAGGWLMAKWYSGNRIRKQRLKFEKQQAIEKERTRIATDMHDDLGSGLTRIKFITESMEEAMNDASLQPQMEKLKASSSELVEKMSEIIWAMNEKNNTLEDMIFYLRSYAVGYCNENNLMCEFHVQENIPQKIIGGHIRRNVFLVLKESLHNIVKHAGAKKVMISIKTDNKFALIIADDGKGFDQILHQSGNGLLNMKERAESLKGKLSLFNTAGTTIELEIPI